tara:strand:- start:12763 stop:13524 length:762 start_codon:yes stop_codon:yes gene_type:complete
MSVIKRAIVIPDQHFPIEDKKAVSVVLKAIKIVKPTLFINLGDVGEWASVSPWKWKRKKKPPVEYQLPIIDREIIEVNRRIDIFDEALDEVKCKKKIICAGNHDEWLDSFVGEHPYLSDYTFKEACGWKERGYKYYSFNHPVKIGKLTFIHGAYTTQYHAKKHLDSYGENIIYGHTHDIQRHTKTDLGGTKAAWSLGCLKDMSPQKNKWLRGRLHNWNHAFAIIDWFRGGNFKVEVNEIINGKTTVWGHEINA